MIRGMNAILSRKMAEQMPISRHFGAIDAIARSARASPVLQSRMVKKLEATNFQGLAK